jgi:hypothetical protein
VPEAGNVLLNPRYTMSILRGPLTRVELKRAREGRGRIWSRGLEADGID